MAVLPPIDVGSGVNVTLRARAAGVFMLDEITRKIGYTSPDLLVRGEADGYVGNPGTVGSRTLYGYARTNVQNRTRVMRPASPLYMNPSNDAHTYFVSWADATQYAKIDDMLTKYVNALFIEVLGTTVVP